jgi:hypothetical protein
VAPAANPGAAPTDGANGATGTGTPGVGAAVLAPPVARPAPEPIAPPPPDRDAARPAPLAVPRRAPRPAPRISVEAALYLTLILLAAVTRFWDLGAKALDHDESLLDYYSWTFATGDRY